MTIRGSVDGMTTKGANGWAYAPARRNDIVVQAVLSHEVIGDAIASDHRPDLAAMGMNNGNCGYSITFYREIDPLYLPFVSIKVDGGDIELPRVSRFGFGEFFAALRRSHPAAGRSRSVLGGLWTDRTDAAAMLEAKVAIGQISGDVGTPIGSLIHLGLTVLPPPDRPETGRRDDAMPTAAGIAALIERPEMLAVMRAVLDDNPLVLNAEICRRDTALVQPSAENRLPSPAECLAVATPTADRGIAVEIVRDSHRLPEYTASGISRWESNQAHAGVELAAQRQGMITRYDIPAGAVAIIGPGTIYRLRCAGGADALKLCCVPSRAMPMTLATDGSRGETVRRSGVRVFI